MDTSGRIIKGIAGFYYVHTTEGILYECKAKGSFRKDGKKPLVGDYVTIQIVDEAQQKGNIQMIHERTNELIRPAVANIDQALVIFAITDPEPNFFLLDTFLARMEYLDIDTVLVFNKCDLDVDGSLRQKILDDYAGAGYRILFTSVKQNVGVEMLKDILKDKCTTVAGPSGVGKSSLINECQQTVQMKTGSISEKTARGKHTTRHSELIQVSENSFIMDTPGFTSLSMEGIKREDIAFCFPEMRPHEQECRFTGCAHINEPDCAIKQRVSVGEISQARYDSYVMMYQNAQNKRRN